LGLEGGRLTFRAAVPLAVYVQWWAGSATAAAVGDAVADADALAEGLADADADAAADLPPLVPARKYAPTPTAASAHTPPAAIARMRALCER